MKSQELAQLKQLEMEFIPMKGALIGVDQFVTVPNAHGGVKTVRARVPSDAVQWLIEKLEQQGQQQQQIAQMPQAGQAGLLDPLHQQMAQMSQQMPQNPQAGGQQGQVNQQFIAQQGAQQTQQRPGM